MCIHIKKLVNHFGYLILLNKPFKKLNSLNSNQFVIFNNFMNWLGSAGLFFCPTGCWMLMLSRSKPGLKFLADSFRWLGDDAGVHLGNQQVWWLGHSLVVYAYDGWTVRGSISKVRVGEIQAEATRLLMTALDANLCHILKVKSESQRLPGFKVRGYSKEYICVWDGGRTCRRLATSGGMFSLCPLPPFLPLMHHLSFCLRFMA